jgi:hypothetical protein
MYQVLHFHMKRGHIIKAFVKNFEIRTNLAGACVGYTWTSASQDELDRAFNAHPMEVGGCPIRLHGLDFSECVGAAVMHEWEKV